MEVVADEEFSSGQGRYPQAALQFDALQALLKILNFWRNIIFLSPGCFCPFPCLCEYGNDGMPMGSQRKSYAAVD